jgi:hypothetical protein
MAHQFNSSSKPRRLSLNQTWIKQKGAALILIAFILGLGAAVYVLKTYNADAERARQDEKTYKVLNDAKNTLIAWAVNYKNAPGQMPWPDRKEAVSPNYDGSSDCVATTFIPSYLLGQLPSLPATSPCVDPNNGSVSYSGLSTYPGLGQEFRDAQGNRLWYAVSRNLVHDYEHAEDPIINPGMVNAPHAITPYLRQGGTQSYPWLQVLDRNGNLVSDRVAAVLIAPGEPIGGQNRSGVADPDQFLDGFKIGAASYKNSDYSLVNEDFIMGEDSRGVPASDTTYVKPYYFNDKLVYITIDELMAALEKRAAAEVKTAIKNYKLSTGYNPYASILGGNKNYSCVTGSLAGALPIAAARASSCTYTGITSTSSTSSCSFTDVDSVIFTKTGANFNGSSGACQFNKKVCTCSGAGSCTRSVQSFTCDSAGLCSANTSGTYNFSGGAFDSVTSKCASSCGTDITCSGIGGGTFAHSNCTDSPFNDVTTHSKLPTWFTNNLWQNYIYYAAQRGASPTLSAGGRNGITALAITTGYPVLTTPYAAKAAPQLRLSCNLSDNLDTNINITGIATGVYESLSKPRSLNYNDQIFVISP